MKFFKGRLVHNIYLLVSVIFFLIGLFISTYSSNKETVFGIGKVLEYSFCILSILLIIIYFLPRRVFLIWKYLSIPSIIYIFTESVSDPIFDTCLLLNCNRYANTAFLTLVFSIGTLIMAILVSIIWHFKEKISK